MSQNKTVIQGLEPADKKFDGTPNGVGQEFYSRTNPSVGGKGTIVSGMADFPFSPSAQEPVSAKQPKRTVQPGKPVVGFLYSVSRTPLGEFWPLQMGRNTIGQSSDNDIVLSEGTVSANHAVIVIRMGKNGLIAALRDPESTNGTLINGEGLDFEAEECHNGDIITIGKNYQLIFFLVDAEKYGLTPNQDFISVEVKEEDDDDVPIFEPGSTRPGGDFYPFEGFGGTQSAPSGTIGLDGSISGNNHGGTVTM